jgi:hypothetical protein
MDTTKTKKVVGRPSHCVKVSERKASYESHMTTHHSLINLGKSLASREKHQQAKTEKYEYLLSAIKDLDGFDGSIFMTEYERSSDSNLLKAKTYSLVRYIAIFKELHKSTISSLEESLNKVSDLTKDLADQNEQIDSYIAQLDDADVFAACKTSDVIQLRGKLKNLRSDSNTLEVKLLKKISVYECENLKNITLIWILLVTQVVFWYTLYISK